MCVPMLGAAIGAAGSLISGLQQSAAYSANAKLMKLQAASERSSGAYESQRAGENLDRLTGKQITAVAAMGLDPSGTPLDVITDSRTEGELDKAAIRANWQQRSNMSLYQSKVDKMNAKTAKIGAVVGALAPLINGMPTQSLTGIGGAFA